MEPISWLTISYNLPTEPSRPRVAAWRALKRLGAVNVQSSIWILSMSDENRLALEGICRDIGAANGECMLTKCVALRQEDESRIVSQFNAMRNVEYDEWVRECEKYLKEIEKEIGKEKFIYAELEEEEAEYEKLSAWHAKIAARDLYGAEGAAAAGTMLQEIRKAYEGYSELVYAHEAKE